MGEQGLEEGGAGRKAGGRAVDGAGVDPRVEQYVKKDYSR